MKKSITALLTLGILISAVTVVAAAGIPAGVPKWLYVSNVNDPSITVLDAKELTVYDTIFFRNIKGTAQNHFLSISEERYIWICEGVGKIGAAGGFVQVVDTQTKAPVPGLKWMVGCGVGNRMTKDQKYVFTSSPNQINVFDVVNKAYLGAIPSNAGAHQYWTNAAGTRLWEGGNAVGTPLNRQVRVYDISGLPNVAGVTLVNNISVAINDQTHDMVLYPNEKYAFTGPIATFSGSGLPTQVITAVIDTSTMSVVHTVPATPQLRGFHTLAISPDGKYLAGIDYMTGTIGRINISALAMPVPDLSTIQVVTTVDGSGQPDCNCVRGDHAMYTLDGKHLLLTTFETGAVAEGAIYVMNAHDFTIKRTLITGKVPHGFVYVNGVGW